MSRLRMMQDDEPQPDASQSPRTTIVGGRPPEKSPSLPPVPTGMQRLLRLAAVDSSFRQELIDKRTAVAEPAGITLTASEVAILRSIPATQLLGMVEGLPAPPAARRDFLRQTAATAVVLLGGAALSESVSGCRSSPGPGPITPEQPAPSEPLQLVEPSEPFTQGTDTDQPGSRPDGGAEPYELPPRVEHRDMATGGGAAPDEPPPRPEHPETIRVGGIAPDEPPPK